MAELEKVLCYVCGTLLEVDDDYKTIIPEAEVYPTLIPPSHTFISSHTGLFEVGAILSMIFTTEFNRGAINPSYGTSGYRSGIPLSFIYNGDGISGIYNSNNELINIKNLTYTVLSGLQIWESSVHYASGDQPVSDQGLPYDSPLPEGETFPQYTSIWGVYPYFANTVDIRYFEKQPLTMMNEAYADINFVSESDINKQTVEFPNEWLDITGIETFANGSWVWLNGAKGNSLSTFDTYMTTNIIQGKIVSYKRFIHNGSKVGDRILRFHTR